MSEYKRELERKVKKGGAIAKMLLVRGDTLGCTDSRSVCEVARARGVEMAAASRLREKKQGKGGARKRAKEGGVDGAALIHVCLLANHTKGLSYSVVLNLLLLVV